MIIYNGQLWLLYFELASIRLGGQTYWRTFGFHSWLCVSLFNYGTWIIFLSTYFLQVWAICVDVSLGFVIA
jgi:hypothetical protein